MAIRSLVYAAAIALLCATPALGVGGCPAGLQQWQCDKCAAISNAGYQATCLNLAARGYNLDLVVQCPQQQYPEWQTACLSCISNAAAGQEWRCAKCLPNTVVDKPFCFGNEDQLKIDSDAIVTCASLPLANFFGRAGWRCNDCLYNIAYLQTALGQYNDWRCLKCTDPALLASNANSVLQASIDDARDTCYSLVSGVDSTNRDKPRPTLVTQADDVLTCARTYVLDPALRGQCNTCLKSRTATAAGTWPCASCAAKGAAGATCFNCLNTNPSKTWECLQ